MTPPPRSPSGQGPSYNRPPRPGSGHGPNRPARPGGPRSPGGPGGHGGQGGPGGYGGGFGPPKGPPGKRPFGPPPPHGKPRPQGKPHAQGYGSSRPRHDGPGSGLRLTVLYEDESIIAIDKPADLPMGDPKTPGARTVVGIAARMLPRAAERGEAPIPALAPPEGVSGVVLFAKARHERIKLWNSVKGNRADRLFFALVCGSAPGGKDHAGTASSVLRLNRRGVYESVPEGEPADDPASVTHYRVVHAGDRYSLLRVRAEGDHPAQVRVHLAEMGCPIAGDRAYSAPENPLGRPGLHLAEVGFVHPRTKEKVRIVSPPPAEFYEIAGREPPKHAQREETLTASDRREPRETDEGWEHVAGWYSDLIGGRRADHQTEVIFPGVVRMLNLTRGERVLDVACGSGHLGHELIGAGAGEVVGIDAAPTLIEHARSLAEGDGRLRFEVGDARAIGASLSTDGSPAEGFDAAVCVMALMNIDPIEPVLRGVSSALREGGRAVVVLLHPAFRMPKRSGWLIREDESGPVLSRRIDSYLSAYAAPIVMNPGEAASGAQAVQTTTHHRPLEVYLNALSESGLLIDAVEEWASNRTSKPGPRADAENTARQEIPLFLAIRGRKVSPAV